MLQQRQSHAGALTTLPGKQKRYTWSANIRDSPREPAILQVQTLCQPVKLFDQVLF